MNGWIAEGPERAPSDESTTTTPRRRRGRVAAAMLAGAALCGLAFPASRAWTSSVHLSKIEYMDPLGKPPTHATMSARGVSSPNLLYGGGSIQAQPKVYLVFWGKQWSSDPSGEAGVLQSSLSKLYGSSDTWSTIMNQYCQGAVRSSASCVAAAASAGVTFVSHDSANPVAGVWFDNGANAPSSPSQTNLGTEAITAAAHFGNTAPASNGSTQYVIATAHGASSAGFGSQYCAWHSAVYSSYGTLAFTNLPYITDAGYSCGANFVNSGTAGLTDGVTIVEGHEYAETVTDPLPGGGWVDAQGSEIGDKCAWIRPGSPGGAVDLQFGTTKFAVQGLWSNATTSCLSAMTVSAPTLSGVAPQTVPVAGGTQVTLSGTNLTGAVVTVAGSVVIPTSANATDIVIKSPAHAVGTAPVVVATPGGTVSGTLTYAAPTPAITTISPASGPVAGWHQVKIDGSNLFPGSVTVGGVAVTPVSGTPTEVVVNVPGHNPGTVPVVITTNSGVASTSVSYVAAPTVTGITPARGPSAGGTVVTIAGTNLTGASVTVAGIIPTVVSSSATSLVIKTPAHADGAEPVVLTTIGGVASTSYLFADAPTASSLSVPRGPAVGGTIVTLNGTFLSGATVSVGGRAAKVVSIDPQGRSVTFVMPAQASSTTATVVATTPYGATSGLTWSWTR